MSTTPGTMLARCSARCNGSGFMTKMQGRRSVSSGPFVGSDVVIPPASPRYVTIPQPPQQSPVVVKQRKGTLPKPRTPLKRTKKQLPWHLENTAPEPVVVGVSKDIPSYHKDRVEWKAKEAQLRRKNFLEGYTSLRIREAGRSGKGHLRGKGANANRFKPQMAPEQSYEEMSRPSILSYMAKPQTWKHAKRTDEEIEARRARYAQIQEAKYYERQTDVHTLYINAKDFIVNSEQLEARLTKVFDSEFYKHNKDKNYGIWDEEGWPEDTAYLMDRAQIDHGVNAAESTGYTEIARRRIMKVTADMTGGKLVHEGSNAGSR